MSDGKDPAIKIFGRTIPLPEGQAPSDPGEVSDPDPNTAVESGKNSCIETTSLEDKGSMVKATEESEQSKQSSSSDHRHRGAETRTGLKLEQQQGEADEEKILKKPDKILPCPRCNSLDTKFCYYNNYNVNQPRHFCKNCQRYWTAGGTMRNVPVGAGRRKTKHPPSLYRQIMVPSEEMPCVSLDANDSAHHQAHSGGLKGNGAGPLCDSIVSNLGDQKTGKGEEPMCSSLNQVEIDCVGTADHEEQFEMPGCSNGPPPPLHHLTPLVFPWWNNPTAMGAGWCSPELYGQNTPLWAPSPILPIPFMPTSYWGCMPGWPNVGWNAPMVGSYGQVLPSSATGNGECSPNGSPTLGKHSRDNGLEGEERKEKSLWIPKTLRIDDPDEAAKSSIWATLGIKPDGSIAKGGMLKAFHSKTESKDRRTGATQILCANPAALCRSQTFQEST